MGHLTICGAGVFGLTLAWSALKRGAKVTVIDPNGPGSGASGGIVGALQPHAPDPWNEKKQFQLESLIISTAYWAGVEACSGLSTGYAKVGRLCPLKTAREVTLAENRKAAIAEHWPRAETWRLIDAPKSDWCPASPTGLYLHDTLSAILNPRRATASLAAAIAAKGGQFTTAPPGDGPVVWATGWQGLQDLGAWFAAPVGNGVKGQAALLAHNAAGLPQIYAEGLHIIPHTDGTVAVGSTSERDFADPTTTDNALEDVLDRARTALPALKNAQVLERWAGVRPRAASRAPLLGPWPGRAGHFIANGGFKIGFGMAPKSAESMCDLIFDKIDRIPVAFHTNQLIPTE
jgi:glycine oxidase